MISALIAAIVVIVYARQGIQRCADGDRYTSGKLQPTPFNRRFCSWPPKLLMWTTWASFVAIAATLGGWKQALLFVMLPGVAFCVNLPTTTDGPAMLLAWGSSLALNTHPFCSICMAIASGLLHERAPVFASLYSWSPLPLIGLAAPLLAAFIKGAASPDRCSPDPSEKLVGHTLWGAIEAHRTYVNMLGDTGLVWSLRGLPVMAGYLGTSVAAWACLGVAFASRILGTDTSRYIMWGALPMIRELDPPLWMLALQTMTFRRVGQ